MNILFRSFVKLGGHGSVSIKRRKLFYFKIDFV